MEGFYMQVARVSCRDRRDKMSPPVASTETSRVERSQSNNVILVLGCNYVHMPRGVSLSCHSIHADLRNDEVLGEPE